jgi:hypothetical protein
MVHWPIYSWKLTPQCHRKSLKKRKPEEEPHQEPPPIMIAQLKPLWELPCCGMYVVVLPFTDAWSPILKLARDEDEQGLVEWKMFLDFMSFLGFEAITTILDCMFRPLFARRVFVGKEQGGNVRPWKFKGTILFRRPHPNQQLDGPTLRVMLLRLGGLFANNDIKMLLVRKGTKLILPSGRVWPPEECRRVRRTEKDPLPKPGWVRWADEAGEDNEDADEEVDKWGSGEEEQDDHEDEYQEDVEADEDDEDTEADEAVCQMEEIKRRLERERDDGLHMLDDSSDSSDEEEQGGEVEMQNEASDDEEEDGYDNGEANDEEEQDENENEEATHEEVEEGDENEEASDDEEQDGYDNKELSDDEDDAVRQFKETMRRLEREDNERSAKLDDYSDSDSDEDDFD